VVDVVVWLRNRLVGGGECIAVGFRVDALREVAVVVEFAAVMETEYP
jgi:hypothetical protein